MQCQECSGFHIRFERTLINSINPLLNHRKFVGNGLNHSQINKSINWKLFKTWPTWSLPLFKSIFRETIFFENVMQFGKESCENPTKTYTYIKGIITENKGSKSPTMWKQLAK